MNLSSWILISFICLLSAPAIPQRLDSLLRKGVDLANRGKFDPALAVFDDVIAFAPDRPDGYFFKAATYLKLSRDYRNLSFADKFDSHINKAIRICRDIRKSGESTGEDLFYYGGAVGLRGIYRTFYADWFGAFKDGMKAKSILEEAFNGDSTDFDIYYGLGEYNYWRAAITKIPSWPPLLRDRRSEGIGQLFIAMDRGRFARDEAAYALIAVYDNEKDPSSVLSLWNSHLAMTNPSNPYALYFVGRAKARLGLHAEAIATFETLLELFIRSPYYDPAAELDVYYHLGLFSLESGNREEALRYLTLAKDLSEVMVFRKDIQEAVDNSKGIYERALARADK